MAYYEQRSAIAIIIIFKRDLQQKSNKMTLNGGSGVPSLLWLLIVVIVVIVIIVVLLKLVFAVLVVGEPYHYHLASVAHVIAALVPSTGL